MYSFYSVISCRKAILYEMRARGERKNSRIGIAAVIGKLDHGDTRGTDVKVSGECRVRNAHKAGEKGEAEALVSEECDTLVAMLYHLVLAVGNTLVAERLDELIGACLNTRDAGSIVLLGESRMLIPFVTERRDLVGMEELLHLRGEEEPGAAPFLFGVTGEVTPGVALVGKVKKCE